MTPTVRSLPPLRRAALLLPLLCAPLLTSPEAAARPRAVVRVEAGGAAAPTAPPAPSWDPAARSAADDVMQLEADLVRAGLRPEQAALLQLQPDHAAWMALSPDQAGAPTTGRGGCAEARGLPTPGRPSALRVEATDRPATDRPELLIGGGAAGRVAVAHLRPGDVLTRVHVETNGGKAAELITLEQGGHRLRLRQIGDRAQLCGE
ncbi:MAG: hypothetical protein JNM72_11050 [Deltaproteobacteria bacterium]|jgi:hypothetical protein|nr:hypothetical protein [Deltaproteobacteria bacterium]